MIEMEEKDFIDLTVGMGSRTREIKDRQWNVKPKILPEEKTLTEEQVKANEILIHLAIGFKGFEIGFAIAPERQKRNIRDYIAGIIREQNQEKLF